MSLRTCLPWLALALAACGNPAAGDRPTTVETFAGGATAEEPGLYTCPMHPHYTSEDPDGICPICGMDLVPADTQSATLGDGSVAVSSEMIQSLGIRTAPVRQTDFSRTLRAYGTVEADESLQTSESSRLEGWISDLRVRAVGDPVRAGQLLYRIYSPDLVGAQKDLLNSLRIGNSRRIEAVRQRLQSLGMQPGTIDRVAESGEIIERVPIYAESSGTVSEIMVADGAYVKPGAPILSLQDFGSVWVIARIPEGDLPLVRTGLPVSLSFPSAPAANGQGEVDYIYPTIDPATRTAQLRVSLPNADGSLRPGAYADLDFELTRDMKLSVPAQAILRDGDGAYVVVALGDGRFAARPVVTGETSGDRTVIVSGLQDGDSVVVNGQFLLGSEANLREGFARLNAALGPDTPLSELPVDADTLALIDHFVDQALYFHEALTDGYRIDPYFVDPALSLVEPLRARFGVTRFGTILDDVDAALRSAKAAADDAALRSALAALMEGLEPWLLEGAPASYETRGLALFTDTASGRLWLQQTAIPDNPYVGTTATLIPWPDPMAMTPMESSPTQAPQRQPVNPHAGHRH